MHTFGVVKHNLPFVEQCFRSDCNMLLSASGVILPYMTCHQQGVVWGIECCRLCYLCIAEKRTGPRTEP